MSSTPCRVEHRGHEQTDRTGAGHEHAVGGGDPRQCDRVQRDRGRLGERGGARGQVLGHRDQLVGGRDHVAGERTPEREVVGRWTPETHRRSVGAAGPALAAPRRGAAHHALPDAPAVDRSPVAVIVPAHS